MTERVIEADHFPRVDIPDYSKGADPHEGIASLNTKINTLTTILMLLNDKAASGEDLKGLRSELLGVHVQQRLGKKIAAEELPDVNLKQVSPEDIEVD